jgi:hypothetical protein
MDLHEFLSKSKISPEKFAEMVGSNPTTVYRWLNGDTIPKKANLLRIIAVTNGEVSADSLFAIAPPLRRAREAAL